MPLIELRQATKVYTVGDNRVYAMNKIDLKIEKEEFVAIVGKSGSGKSTLMNAIGCLDGLTSGEYLLGGNRVGNLSDKKLSKIRSREIGFIFQGFNLIPTLTALENVELPLTYRRIPKDKRQKICLAALKDVGLGGRENHLPGELSGGQQQRVAIARAISSSPPIILADEPTGNLDSGSGEDVMRLLRRLNDTGRTIVLITHDNQTAGKAKRIVRISDGKIVSDYINDPPPADCQNRSGVVQ